MKKFSLTIKDSSIAFVSSFIICQLAVIIAAFAILICSPFLGIGNPKDFANTCIGTLITGSTMLLTLLAVFLFLNKNKENPIFAKPKTSKTIIYILIAAATFFALYPIVNCFNNLLIKIGFKINELTYELNTKNYFISLIHLAILPAICEELMYRGLIFKGLKNHGKKFAIITSSLMFAIYHMSVSQTIYPMLFGALLATVMFKENNLFYCIIMHFTNNLLALTVSYLKINLIFKHWTYILLAIVLATIFITLLILFIKKQKNIENIQKFDKTDKIFIIIAIIIMLIFWIISNINI